MSRSLVARTYPCTPAMPPMTTNLTWASRSASSSSSAWNIARRALLQFAQELAQAKCLLEPILRCLLAILPSPDRARAFLAGPLFRRPGRGLADRHRANHATRRWFGFGELEVLAPRSCAEVREPLIRRSAPISPTCPTACASCALHAGSRYGSRSSWPVSQARWHPRHSAVTQSGDRIRRATGGSRGPHPLDAWPHRRCRAGRPPRGVGLRWPPARRSAQAA